MRNKIRLRRSALLLAVSLWPLAAAKAAIEPAQTENLGNGLTLVIRPDRTSPRVAISLLVRAGAADETAETAGWRRLLVNSMLRGGPKNLKREEGADKGTEALSRAAEAAGGQIGATVGDDFAEIWAAGDSAQSGQLLELILSLLREPRLSDADIDATRDRLQTQIDGGNQDLATRTTTTLRSQLYRDARGELVAYGLPDFGTVSSLRNLTNDRVRELFATKFRSARLVVAATGDVDAKALRERLEQLPAGTGNAPATPYFTPPDPTKQPTLVVREFPTATAWVFVAYPLPELNSGDIPALRVLSAALGDSERARLPARLLQKRMIDDPNAVLTAATQFVPRRYAGEMVVFAQTGPQGVESVKNALLDEMRKAREVPLSPGELQSAKNYLRGAWAVERENLRDRAFQTALASTLGGVPDTTWPARIEAVTPAEIQRVAQKYLKAYAVALVMPQN